MRRVGGLPGCSPRACAGALAGLALALAACQPPESRAGRALPGPARVDPRLNELAERGADGLSRTPLGDLLQVRGAGDEAAVRVLLELRPGATVDLAALGASRVRAYGSVRSAFVPVRRLAEYSAHPDVLRLEAARRLRPLLDLSVPGTAGLHLTSPGPPQGTGVVVGVVDTGVDWKHLDFHEGTDLGAPSRIVSSWHQNLRTPPSGSYVMVDSPCDYAAYANTYVETRSGIPLPAAATSCRLRFWQRVDTEQGRDYAKVYVRIGGSGYLLAQYSGTREAEQTDLALDSYRGSTVYPRFTLTADNLVQYDGWFLDDVSVRCVVDGATETLFSSDMESATAWAQDWDAPTTWRRQFGRPFSAPAAGEDGHSDCGGHGSHVAGIATGGGLRSSSPRFLGVSPSSDVVAVSTVFMDADILEGVEHAFRVADPTGLGGQPAVVNLSLGGHSGPHDGTELFDRGMDELSGPGRVVVAAAGNEGNDLIHVAGTVTNTPDLQFFQFDDANGGYAIFDLYHDSPHGLRVAIKAGNKTSPSMAPSPTAYTGVVNNQITYRVENAASGTDPLNGKQHIYLQLNADSPLSNGQILLSLLDTSHPNAQFHAWLYYGDGSIDAGGTFPGDGVSTIGTPATAFQTVSVAAYVTREGAGWGTLGNLAGFSSRGPTADGRPPDIAAPGSLIWSVNSSSISADAYTDMQGTSMACPHVTGLAALLLQRSAALDPEGVRSILAESARVEAGRTPPMTPSPNNDWGWGKVDGDDAVALAAQDLPRLTGASFGPATIGARTVPCARATGFTPRKPGAAQKYRYQWQRLVDGLYRGIWGADYRCLPWSQFAAGDSLRVVVAPVEDTDGSTETPYRRGFFVGGAATSAPVAVTADAVWRGYLPETGWAMVSVPVDGATDAFAGDLRGTKYRWVESAQSFQAATSFPRGEGFFVYARTTEGALHATGTDSGSDFVTPRLTRTGTTGQPGRHLLGNPFPRPVYWQNLEVSADGLAWDSVTDAPTLVEPTYWAEYRNRDGQYNVNAIGDLDGTIFPWQGFWIIANAPILLRIRASQPVPPELRGFRQVSYPRAWPTPQDRAGGLAEGEPDADERAGGAGARDDRAGRPALPAWQVRLVARSGALLDRDNFVGVHRDALPERDALDVRDAGTMNDPYVVLAIDRTGWADRPGLYARDLQRLHRRHTYRWPLRVQSHGVGEVALSHGRLPDGWTFTLVDAQGRAVDLAATPEVRFAPPASGVATFTLVASVLERAAPR